MKRLNVLWVCAVLSLSAFSAAPVMAQERVSKYCERDADIFCRHVKPGQGRIGRCLLRNKERVAVPCKAVLETAVYFIQKQFANVCHRDLRHHCSRIQPGNGRIMRCLQDHYDALSASCSRLTTQLTGYTPPSDDDY